VKRLKILEGDRRVSHRSIKLKLEDQDVKELRQWCFKNSQAGDEAHLKQSIW
jgi:DNA-binding response OmpR family regulator